MSKPSLAPSMNASYIAIRFHAPTSRKAMMTLNKVRLPSSDDTAAMAAVLSVARNAMNPPRTRAMLPSQARTTGSCSRRRCMTATLSSPTSEDADVASKMGRKTSVGSAAPCCARYMKIVTGSTVRDEAFSTRKRIWALVAVFGSGFRLCRACIARRPMGAAALSRPRPLAAKSSVMRPSAGCPEGTPGMSRRNRGASSRPSSSISPAASAMRRKPSHRVNVPNRRIIRLTESSAMSNRLVTSRAKTSASPRKIHWYSAASAAIRKKASHSPFSIPGRPSVDAALALDQFNLVTVRILDKGDDGRAVLHGTGLAHDIAAPGLDFFTGRIGVVDFDGDMTVAIAKVVAGRVPVVRQFQDGTFIFVLVSDKCQREAAVGIVFLAQKAHSQNISVEGERFFQVADTDHGV